LPQPLWSRIIAEKRATFSCRPDVARPGNQTAVGNLYLAGDYTAGDYPATLESAVRSGVFAANLVRQR
ncbi:MAG: FAD-dependent oxidoreductase, partial [Pseudomonadota bacterium]